ncbi:MAG: protein kinase, partial [Blastocatellia bacterium]
MEGRRSTDQSTHTPSSAIAGFGNQGPEKFRHSHVGKMITRTISHYRIIEILGAGGMGEVFLAEDLRLERKVALKVLPAEVCSDEGRVRRFMQEARAASALNHPNIITVYDIGEGDVGRFIVMEYIEGRTLRTAANETVSIDLLATIGSQISKALGVAHAVGIIHRDIKPENVMVRNDGYVKVLDFGLARLSSPIADESSANTAYKTGPGTVVGTVAYMSPEQARGESLGVATDIFSLGIVLYELATGRHPFRAESTVGFLHAIVADQAVPPSRLNPEVPASLERIILQMLEKESRLRPNALEVEAALSQLNRIKELEKTVTLVMPPASGLRSPAGRSSPRLTVGREAERERLRDAMAAATSGQGSMICIAGEPGIGKTTLVEDFLGELSAGGGSCSVARGRCSERMAGTEAYLPFLEALEGLLRGEHGGSAARLMRVIAPTWYVQVAPQLSESTADRLNDEVRNATQQQMKRQLATLLVELSQQRPLILFFDDLQWADLSTVDLLAYMATRLEGMRLLILTTYRSSEMLLSKHPFLQVKLDLQGRGLCHEIPLGFLAREDIDHYLGLTFPNHRFPGEFLNLIYEKTEGSPLFMVDLLHYLCDLKVISRDDTGWFLEQSVPDLERDLPESVKSMIQRKIDQLTDDDRKLLICACVQGYEFDSAVLSRALSKDSADVEDRLEVLEREHAFLKLTGEQEFPDGTLTLRYRFIHALYQNVLHTTLKPTRKASLSVAVAQALLGYYGEDKASEVASELALLFESARDFDRASAYFMKAAKQALKVFAYQEAAALSRRGVDLILKLPASPERDQRELDGQMTLGLTLPPIKGFAAPEVESAFSRARELCEQFGESPALFRVLYGLWTVYVIRADFQTAHDLADRLMRLAQTAGQPSLTTRAHFARGFTSDYLGDHREAREQYERLLELADPQRYLVDAYIYGNDVVQIAQSRRAWLLWVLGYPDQAAALTEKCVEVAREMLHPFTTASALLTIPQLSFEVRLPRRAQEMAEEAMAISTEYGFPLHLAYAALHHGWAIALQGRFEEGIEEMRRHFQSLSIMGAEMSWTGYQVSMADVYREAGQVEEGLEVVADSLARVARTGERFFEAELYRARGDLLASIMDTHSRDVLVTPQSDAETCPSQDAEASYLRAIVIARERGAKSHELRATIGLSRLMARRGESARALESLSGILEWFREGFDTPDLKTARTLITELKAVS